MAEITQEQWAEIRANLETWSEEQLVNALTSHKFSKVYRRMFELLSVLKPLKQSD